MGGWAVMLSFTIDITNILNHPANHLFTNFSSVIITWGWHNRHIDGRSAKWTQLDSTPP
jgi:hypothetical protein